MDLRNIFARVQIQTSAHNEDSEDESEPRPPPEPVTAAERSFNKHFAVNNLVTCLYLSAVVFYLHYTERLFDVGLYQTSLLPLLLGSAELLKYAIFWYSRNKASPIKRRLLKKEKLYNLVQTVGVLGTTLAAYYGLTVCFGAPFVMKQFHTLSFASIMMVLSVLPGALYIGRDSVFELFDASLEFEGKGRVRDRIFEKFLIIFRLTVFMAWLGASVIPLDWDRPWQQWPIPCYLGAIAGNIAGNLLCLFMYTYDHAFPRKKNQAEAEEGTFFVMSE